MANALFPVFRTSDWRSPGLLGKGATLLNPATMNPPLRGIVPPILTPLSSPDSLDVAGLENLIERLLAGGVHGIFALGTTGEGPSLSHRLRREMVSHTLRLVKGRVPVLVGITDTSLEDSLALARFSAEAGAYAAVHAAPPYFPLSQGELWGFVQKLNAALPLPLFLYNMPGLTKVTFESDTLHRARDLPNVIGVKDSSCDMIYFHKLLGVARERPDWSVLIGPEEMTPEAVLFGAHGGINGGANLHPRLYVSLYEAAVAHNLPEVRRLHAEVMRLAGSVYTVSPHRSALICGLKCALSLLGVCQDIPADPFQPFDAAQRREMRARLETLGLLV